MVKVLADVDPYQNYVVYLTHDVPETGYHDIRSHTIGLCKDYELPLNPTVTRYYPYYQLEQAEGFLGRMQSMPWRMISRCESCFPEGCRALPI